MDDIVLIENPERLSFIIKRDGDANTLTANGIDVPRNHTVDCVFDREVTSLPCEVSGAANITVIDTDARGNNPTTWDGTTHTYVGEADRNISIHVEAEEGVVLKIKIRPRSEKPGHELMLF